MVDCRKQETLVLAYNQQAMDLLHAEQLTEALDLLLRAETQVCAMAPSTSSLKIKSVTFNNLGCFYKRAGQYQKALHYLSLALDIDAHSATDRTNLAGTHLNICAIKSKAGQHRDALNHALEALQLLQGPEVNPTQLTTRVIAHHNAAVELEYLAQMQPAVEMYKAGIRAGKSCLGPEHPLITSLQKCYYGALDKLEKGSTRKKRFASVTPIPSKSAGFQGVRKPPRRSASKDTYSSKPSSSPIVDLRLQSQSYDDGEGWLQRSTISSDEYRQRSRPKAKRVTPGIQLIPLGTMTQEQGLETTQSDIYGNAKFRRKGEVQLRSTMKGLREKLKRPLEVVNIVSTEVVVWKEELIKALRVYQARKKEREGNLEVQSLDYPKNEGLRAVEKRAQAAIQALEQLKREAAHEASLPITPVPKPPPSRVPTLRTARLPKARAHLEVIPETHSEGKAELRTAAVCRVQAWVRSMLAQQFYREHRAAAVKIQAWVRMTQTRKLFAGILAAIQLIQAWWRLIIANRKQ